MPERDHELQGDVLTDDGTDTKLPRAWWVILHNDDYTTMDFVEAVLVRVFHHTHASATQLMLDVHTKGKAVVGRYTRDIAETKVAEATAMAREQGHPLKVTAEPAES